MTPDALHHSDNYTRVTRRACYGATDLTCAHME